MIHTALSNAIFPDVCEKDGFLFIVYMKDGNVWVDTFELATGVVVNAFNTPCSNQGFPRIRNVNGSIWIVYRPGDGLSVIVREIFPGSTEFKYNGVFFNWPATLSANGFNLNEYKANPSNPEQALPVQLGTYKYDGTFFVGTPAVPGSGLAFDRVSNDDARFTETRFGMVNPQYAEELFCGESFEGGVVVVDDPTENKKTLLEGQYTYVPKICKYDDKWAIVTSDYNRPIQLFYDISRADIVVNPSYNPKTDLIIIRQGLEYQVSELQKVIDKL